MSGSTLRSLINSAVQLDADTVNFIWHGGEPLLAGLEFFSDAVSIQAAVKEGTGKRFLNSLQTNGTLVNSSFAEFFKRHKFFVGLSLDGPAFIHDNNRSSNRGGSYEQSLRGYKTLKDADVDPGIVCVVDPNSLPEIDMFIDWLEDIGADSVSLNPIFAKRAEPPGNYPIFLGSLKDAITCRHSQIRIRELIFPGTTTAEREKMGIMNACHPGWPCYETISTVDEEGYIYFSCDRFLDNHLSKKEVYRLSHVENGGFRKALASDQFSKLSALAKSQQEICMSVCSLFLTCDGGCVADWMLLPNKQAMKRPNVVYCQGVRTITNSRSQMTLCC